MPTRSRKEIIKLLLMVFTISILLLALVAILGYRNSESRRKITSSVWNVVNIKVHGKNSINDFKWLTFSLMKDGRIILPEPRSLKRKATFPIKLSNWKYERRNFFNGQIIIDDWVKNYFSGVYEIEIVEKSKPQLMRLYSDSIEFYLREQYFTIENPTIESEPYYIPEKGDDSTSEREN